MNRWWKNVVKDYLTFSRNERYGIIILMVLIVAVVQAPRFFKKKREPLRVDAFQQELAKLKISVDSTREYRRFKNDDDEQFAFSPSPDRRSFEVRGELFPFDPNTIGAAEWKRLGVRDRTIETILKFVGKGYKFRQPEDIRKIYGLRTEEADRLIPYIRIANDNPAQSSNTFAAAGVVAPPSSDPKRAVPSTPRMVDINQADTAAFIALPGIGSKLAMRITTFRDKLGGFASVNQVAETYGLPDSTFQLIKPRLQCLNPVVRTININTADVNSLKIHPYLRWHIANAIVNYRQQHGLYKSKEDLKKIDLIDEQLFQKVSPYLVVD